MIIYLQCQTFIVAKEQRKFEENKYMYLLK